MCLAPFDGRWFKIVAGSKWPPLNPANYEPTLSATSFFFYCELSILMSETAALEELVIFDFQKRVIANL